MTEHKSLSMLVHFQDDVYTRVCDLEDSASIFGADILYHNDCMRAYLRTYDRPIQMKDQQKCQSERHKTFHHILQEIKPGLKSGYGHTLSTIRDLCNQLLDHGCKLFENREIKLLLINCFGTEINFAYPIEANKSALVYMENCTKEDMANIIRSMYPISDNVLKT